ncbi:MAG: hypothetical protein QXO51_07805 [Halobacteria archaeon]
MTVARPPLRPSRSLLNDGKGRRVGHGAGTSIPLPDPRPGGGPRRR